MKKTGFAFGILLATAGVCRGGDVFVQGQNIRGTGTIPNAAINGSSITKSGALKAGPGILLTTAGGQTTISSTITAGNLSIYNATATAGFPFGANLSTVTVGDGTLTTPVVTILAGTTNGGYLGALELEGPWAFSGFGMDIYNTSAYNANNRGTIQFSGKTAGSTQEAWDSISVGKNKFEINAPNIPGNLLRIDSITNGVDPTFWFGKDTTSNFSFCFGNLAQTEVRGGQCFDFRDSTQKQFRFHQYVHFDETIDSDEGVSMSTGVVYSTFTWVGLSPGVMHVVAGSSMTATRLVSLSTEVTGIIPTTNLPTILSAYSGSLFVGLASGSTFQSFVPISAITLKNLTFTVDVASAGGGGDTIVCGDASGNKLSVVSANAAAAGSLVTTPTSSVNIAAGTTVYMRLDSSAVTKPQGNIACTYVMQ